MTGSGQGRTVSVLVGASGRVIVMAAFLPFQVFSCISCIFVHPRAAGQETSSVLWVGDVDDAKRLIDEAQQVVVLTGAGISTDSGIPDFRGPQGVWTKNPAAEKTATLQHYVGDPEVRRQAWRNRLESGAYASARPNSGHRALAELARHAALDTLLTQNID